MKRSLKIGLGLSIFLILSTILLISFNLPKSYDANQVLYGDIEKYILNAEPIPSHKQDQLIVQAQALLEADPIPSSAIESALILGHFSLEANKLVQAIAYYTQSLKHFKNYTNIHVKSHLVYELSKAYLYQNQLAQSTESFTYLEKICKEANSEHLTVWYGRLRYQDLTNSGVAKDITLKALEDTLQLAEEINYTALEDVYFDLGVAYWLNDRFIEGIEMKLMALNTAEEKGKDYQVATITTDLGIDYAFSGDYENALYYFDKAIAYNQEDKARDSASKSYAYLNVVSTYIAMNDYEQVALYLEEAKKAIDLQADSNLKKDDLAYYYILKARHLTQSGFPDEALALISLAETRYKEYPYMSYYDFDITLAQAYGYAYFAKGEYERAKAYHLDCAKIAEKRELSQFLQSCYESLYEDYKALEDPWQALHYLEKSDALKSKHSADKTHEYSQYLLNKFESDQARDEIQKLNRHKEQKNLQILLLVGLTIGVSIITIIIFHNNKKIKSISLTDGLTQLYNRRALTEYLTNDWQHYEQSSVPVAFMMLDIDYFKKYNDNYGHAEGDKVLAQVAQCIKTSCRSSDFVARYGGEEFIVIMPHTIQCEAEIVATRLLTHIEELDITHEFSEVSPHITVSIGLSVDAIPGQSAHEDYIKMADDALYRSKQAGRNRYSTIL